VASHPIGVELIDAVAPDLRQVVRQARRLPSLVYADVRLEVVEARFATSENGHDKLTGDEVSLALGVRVLAGDRMVAPGYVGLALGAPDLPRLVSIVGAAIERAWRRAAINAELKADARAKLGVLGQPLADTRLHPVAVHEDRIPAVFEIDPRAVDLGAMARYATEVCRAVKALDARLKYAAVGVLTQIARELFVSTEGAAIDQAFALTEGSTSVVAVSGDGSQELWDVAGDLRGWEVLERGSDDPLLAFPPLREFAIALAGDAVELSVAPPLPTGDRDEVVVTDPGYNTLLSHEIVGHPTELDRALKMETAYAGRSWLLRDAERHQVGKRVASPLVTAFSDPSLPGYGHYAYDHEGVRARRVVHIDRGILTGFMSSRRTAATFGGDPNGHYRATDASLVPLVRMSSTVFAGGARAAADIVKEVDRGFYLSGHRVPSIAESRENFRISARKVYEIRNGELGRLYRDGGIAADSRDYLMHVDAVGDDFRLHPIPNCGKGQPMQSKRLGNGGPTMRSRARMVGG
jgi:TldD protein